MALGQLDNLQSLSRRSKGAKEVLVLDTAEVVPKNGQVREKFGGIEELADSIKSHGQEQPIIVSPKDANGKYRIQKGERRWRACKLAGVPVEAIVNKKDQEELDETAGELIENIQRENLTPMEIAKGIQKFIDAKWKAVDVAKRLGKSRGYISQHLSLLKLPECVQKLYEEDVTADPESLNSLRQIYQIAPEKAERICEKALVDGISRKACRELLKQAKDGTLAEPPPLETLAWGTLLMMASPQCRPRLTRKMTPLLVRGMLHRKSHRNLNRPLILSNPSLKRLLAPNLIHQRQ